MEADATLENTNKYLGTLTFEKIEAFPTSAPIPVFVDWEKYVITTIPENK